MANDFEYTPVQYKALSLMSGPEKNIMLFGGSRSGKTFFLLSYCILAAGSIPGLRIAILRRYLKDVRESVISDTFYSVMIKMLGWRREKIDAHLNMSTHVFRTPIGSEIWFGGLDDKDRVEKILGKEYGLIYFNEVSQIPYQSIQIARTRLAQRVPRWKNRFLYDCNPPKKTHWCYRLFVEKQSPDRTSLDNPEDYVSLKMNPEDNKANIAESYLEILNELKGDNRKRFLQGEFTDENENALWKQSIMIDPFRVVSTPPDLERIVVGVDPAVTSKESSDETGIVVVGKKKWGDGKSHYYVLDDSTVRDTPRKWAIKIAETYRRYSADRIVAEVNQGGDLVQELINSVGAGLPVKTVRATRGKIVRAEPIAALYEQGLVHHVGSFPELEDEMTSYTGYDSETSPDRMDALVWAITELADAPEVNFDNTSFF